MVLFAERGTPGERFVGGGGGEEPPEPFDPFAQVQAQGTGNPQPGGEIDPLDEGGDVDPLDEGGHVDPLDEGGGDVGLSGATGDPEQPGSEPRDDDAGGGTKSPVPEPRAPRKTRPLPRSRKPSNNMTRALALVKEAKRFKAMYDRRVGHSPAPDDDDDDDDEEEPTGGSLIRTSIASLTPGQEKAALYMATTRVVPGRKCSSCCAAVACLLCTVEDCQEPVCCPPIGGCVNAVGFGHELFLDSTYKFKCGTCLFERREDIPSYMSVREHYKEILYPSTFRAPFVFVWLRADRTQETAAGMGPAALVAMAHAGYSAQDFQAFELNVDDVATWEMTRTRILSCLENSMARIVVSVEAHDAGHARYEYRQGVTKGLSPLLHDMLGRKLACAIADHGGPKCLWVLSCLPPSSYRTRLETARSLLKRDMFDAIGFYSTMHAQWTDMRSWTANWLLQWYHGRSPIDAMRDTQPIVSPRGRVAAVLVIPSGNHGEVVARQFWSTGNGMEVATGGLLTVDGIGAMSCPECGVTPRMAGWTIGGPLPKIKCKEQGCKKWRVPAGFILPQSIDFRGECGPNAGGAFHRFIWEGPFPMPRVFA